MNTNNKQVHAWQSANYQIKVDGFIESHFSDSFAGMTIQSQLRNDHTAVTLLTGYVLDQSQLIGVLTALFNMRLPILSIDMIDEKNGTNK